jgi:UDP-N-acetylglucosamine acyltransferase
MALTVSDQIHPTAVVSAEVELAPDVVVGPYAVIEGPVRIGPGCVIESHACLNGPLIMGRDNFIGHGAVLGKSPQSRAYKGEPTRLVIGNGNTFREYVTVHRGTVDGGGETVIGDKNLFMISSHVGHDSRIGNACTIVNAALIAGHVILGDNCILSGHVAVQQRCRIGRLAMLAGMGATTKDVPPFILQQGYNCVTGLNIVGMRRAGFSPTAIDAMRQSFRILYKEGRPLHQALDRIEQDFGDLPEAREFIAFIRGSTIGINPSREIDRVTWTGA